MSALPTKLLTHVKDLVCLLNQDGNFVYVSPSIKHIAAYEPSELIGKMLSGFAHPDDVSLFETDNLLKHVKNNSLLRSRFKTRSNIYKWLETQITTTENEHDAIFVTTSRVIEIHKKNESTPLTLLPLENERVQSYLNFVSTSVHEFRTPLAIVRSSIELIEIYTTKHFHLTPEIQGRYKNIFAQIDHLNQLVDALLKLGKLESEIFTSKKEKTDLVDLIKKVIYSFGNTDNQRKAELFIHGNPRMVMADPTLVNHIITNLLSNAFKYSQGTLPPQLDLHFQRNSFTIKIKDFGIGIPENAKNRIFEPFFRADNTLEYNGTGLGLYLAKHLVALHHGKISFISKLNKATEFTVKIPVDKETNGLSDGQKNCNQLPEDKSEKS